jgi:hypothetical protein
VYSARANMISTTFGFKSLLKNDDVPDPLPLLFIDTLAKWEGCLRIFDGRFVHESLFPQTCQLLTSSEVITKLTKVWNLCISDDKYPWILLSDLARYMIMYVHGGVYVDLDLVPLVPISTLTRIASDNEEFVLFWDRADHNLLANYILYSRHPQHPFWVSVIEESCDRILKHSETKNVDYMDVLLLTGPMMLTDIYYSEHAKYHVRVVAERRARRLVKHINTFSWQ